MRRCTPALMFCALLLGLGAGTGSALQAPESQVSAPRYHPEAVEAMNQLYSPFCPGLMLHICTSPQAATLRDSIDVLAEEGWSSDELVEWMLANHGQQYRAAPPKTGWGVWAWVLPPVGILGGLALILLFLRRRVRTQSPSAGKPTGASAVSSEEEERLRSAIRQVELDEDPSF